MKPLNPSTERRDFLRNSGLAITGLGLAGAVAFPAAAQKRVVKGAGEGDVAVLQGALALELEGIAAYQLAGASGLLTPDVLKVALVFLGHHKGH